VKPIVDPKAELAAAREARSSGDDGAACDHLERAVAADATLFEARLDLAELLLDRSAELTLVERALDEAEALRAGDARVERLRGALCEARGDEAAAAAAYARSNEREPDPELLFRRGVLLRRLGREAEAVSAFEEVERARPKDLAAKGHLAALYERSSRYPEAEAELRALADAAPQSPAPLRRLAAFYRRWGDLPRARRADADALLREAPARTLRPLPSSRR
jgi:tetratricopeptide (TPR) repeat protein